jgi:hypothetical protein
MELRHDDLLAVIAAVPAPSKPPSSPDAADLRELSATDIDNETTTFPANAPLLITPQRWRRYRLYIR